MNQNTYDTKRIWKYEICRKIYLIIANLFFAQISDTTLAKQICLEA